MPLRAESAPQAGCCNSCCMHMCTTVVVLRQGTDEQIKHYSDLLAHKLQHGEVWSLLEHDVPSTLLQLCEPDRTVLCKAY